jgi:ribonuclease HI
MELPFEPTSQQRTDRELLAAMRSLTFPDRAPQGAIAIYTDGACSGNPGPGGWAWAVAPEGIPRDSGTERPSTNQRMEIRAAIEALRAHRTFTDPVNIVSDSTYVVNCFRQRWWDGWLSRGWLNSQKNWFFATSANKHPLSFQKNPAKYWLRMAQNLNRVIQAQHKLFSDYQTKKIEALIYQQCGLMQICTLIV